MDDLVCVIRGEWVSREGGIWEFIMSVGRFAKIISIAQVFCYADLVKVITEVFEIPEDVNFRLSFWYPDVLNICSLSRMAPVEISNDVGFFQFKKEFGLLKCLNIFLSYDVDESGNPEEGSSQFSVNPARARSFDEVHVDDEVIDFVRRAEEAYEKNGPDKMIDFLAMEEAEKQLGIVGTGVKGQSSDSSINAEEDHCFLDLVNLVDRNQHEDAIRESTGELCTSTCDTSGPPSLTVVDSHPTQTTFCVGVEEIERSQIPMIAPCLGVDPHIRENLWDTNMPVFDENDPSFADPPPNVNELKEEDKETLYVGRQFDNKEEMKKSLSLYALENHFCYKVCYSDKSRLIAQCVDKNCPWRVFAKCLPEGEKLEIKTLVLRHQCCIDSRGRYGEKATPKVLAEMLQSKFANGKKGPRACDIPDIVLTEMNVTISYRQAWYAREVALAKARGTEEESYKLLISYLSLLVEYNPGTITDLLTVVNKEGKIIFKYLFVSLGAAIAGYPYVRKVVAIDGTHLTGKYKGTLVAASCQDGNMQIFPLAFGIVDSENELSWVWFLENLKKIVHDQVDLVFVSDRHHSINAALKRVYPLAHHGACIIHICRNVNARFKCGGLANLVARAGKAYTLESFQRVWTEIQKRSPACVSYLMDIGLEHWTRIHCTRNRFNLMSSNICESFNASIKKAAEYPIISLVEYVRAMCMRWWSIRREEAANCGSICTTEIEGLLLENLKSASECAVIPSSQCIFQVNDRKGHRFIVDIQKKHCSCNFFDVMKYPCPHGIAAARSKGIDVYSLVDPCYSKEMWGKVYERVIMPVPKPESVDDNENLNEGVLPPQTRRPSGRPKKARYRSKGEFETSQRSGRRCGRCSGYGHNRATCKNEI